MIGDICAKHNEAHTAIELGGGKQMAECQSCFDEKRKATFAAFVPAPQPKKLWLWKNFVNGQPEYWAFENPYPVHPNGDPMVLGSPCGYAIVKQAAGNGRPEKTDNEVLAEILRSQRH